MLDLQTQNPTQLQILKNIEYVVHKENRPIMSQYQNSTDFICKNCYNVKLHTSVICSEYKSVSMYDCTYMYRYMYMYSCTKLYMSGFFIVKLSKTTGH